MQDGQTETDNAQALVKFLDNQFLDVDGEEHKFVKGIFAIFGHGNVLGLGQALEQDSGDMRVFQGRNEQGMAHVATGLPASLCAARSSPAPLPSVRARPI
ncbi:myo-inositol catabolism protein IolD [Raoultella planticola]|nr:myo-inositol catabolism protein IolD [Raoultella planticola]